MFSGAIFHAIDYCHMRVLLVQNLTLSSHVETTSNLVCMFVEILWSEYLTLIQKALVFMCLQYKYFENAAEKEEIALNEQFLLFPQCFLPIRRDFCNFHQI